MTKFLVVATLLLLSALCVLAAPKTGESLTATTSLNVRETPCTNGRLITTLAPQTQVKATGNVKTDCGHTWYQISGSGFATAWAASQYLTPTVGPTPPTPVAGGKNVLLIGDSHTCGTFGRTLDSKLRAHYGATHVATFGRAGMSTRSFTNGNMATKWGWIDFLPTGERKIGGTEEKMTPKLSTLIQTYKPKTVLVALGANEIHNGRDSMRSQLRDAMQTIAQAGAKCTWIAPPQTRCDSGYCPYTAAKLADYYSLLQEVAKANNCHVIKSDPNTLSYLNYNAIIASGSSKGDGIHFDSLGETGRQVLQRWADDVFNTFKSSGAATLSEHRPLLSRQRQYAEEEESSD